MRNIHHRLISLNLALIALLSFSVPAYAREVGEDAQRAEETLLAAPEWALAADEYSAARALTEENARLAAGASAEDVSTSIEEIADGDGQEGVLRAPPMPAQSGSAYLISVDGTYFLSDEVRSGAGWSYEGGNLKLDNYNGREITASGDLYIYTYGTSTVQGKSGVIGANGIAVSGDLDISVRNGSLSVYGGGGTRYGGDAIYTANTFYCFSYGGTAHFAGGNARNGEGGGHGISAGTVHALGSSNSGTRLTATGGAASLYDQGASGGCGILAAAVYVSADAIIRGGDGNVAAPAIFFRHGCEIGCANVELYGGKYSTGSYAKPIQFSPSSDQTWYYHPHTTVNAYGGHYSITVNRYRLTLVGNGGWYGSATFTSLIDYYPSYYDLSKYVFSRFGHTQVAWTDASGDLVPLNDSFSPHGNTYLFAEWVDTQAGDILLNGLSGTLEDGAYWRRYRDIPSVTLPSTLRYDGKEIGLAGWGSSLTPDEDANGMLNGTWYEAGGSVSASPATPTTLYALKNDVGSYVIYHPTDGAPKTGGNMLLQHRYKASCTDLEVYLADGAEYLTAPEGYRFSGWAEQAGGEMKYTAGASVVVTEGSPLHLYAVWQPLEYKYSTPECSVWVEPVSKTITLETPHSWYSGPEQPKTLISAIYDAKGKMLRCVVSPAGTDQQPCTVSMQYTGDTLPTVKAFAQQSGYTPLAGSIVMDLSKMQPSGSR